MNNINAPIVAAVDGSDEATAGLRWAAAAAERENRPLHVVSAADLTAGGYGQVAALADTFSRAAREDAQAAVNVGVKDVRAVAPNVAVSGDITEGRAALALREMSKRAHMLVMGRRGMGGVKGLLLGSVSADVTAHADCPVVVVSGPVPTSGPVVVGVDGSRAAQAAVECGFEQADRLHTSLHAVHAYGGFSSSAFFEHGDVVLRQLRDEAVALTREQLAGLTTRYPDLSVDTDVSIGVPAQRILDAANDAQLVVMGSRGRGGFRGLLFGSVSQNVVQVAQCPVMIVHAQA